MSTVRFALMLCLAALALPGAVLHAQSGQEPTRLTPTVESWDAEPQAGMLLVATRELLDPLFGETVILLLSHGIAGSQGLIINQRSRSQLSELLKDIDAQADDYPLFFGGPLGVHRVFMLMRGSRAVPGAEQVSDDIWFSDSRRVLDDLIADRMPVGALHFYIGYASWTTGQLGMEIARGSWLLIKGDTRIVFDADDSDLWGRLIDELEPNGILVSLDPPALR
jgi:putative transcriptional regulator